MPITNDQELMQASTTVGQLLQDIQDYVGRVPSDMARVRYPRGFLRTADQHRANLTFVEDGVLRTNLAYTLMLSDAILWLLWRTDITATAKDMLIKLCVFIGGTLIESVTKEYLRGICGGSYKDRTAYLEASAIISPQLKMDLDWTWDLRNNMHLFKLEVREYENPYSIETHNRCTGAWHGLREALTARGRIAV